MGSKIFILFGILAFVAAVHCKPSPKKIQITQAQEMVLPPHGFIPSVTLCSLSTSKEDCQAQQAEQAKANDREELARLNKWQEGLSSYGMANWRSELPTIAKRYDELTAKV
ncbi:unnamed protein product [Orchesella dallaii]|uniref:Uncharacterized protein n=1 Tax=Orchesella dallaii TaxID=48710 RepID=A0ABP1RPT4_9HEXA